MADIAQLGFDVDTDTLALATSQLNALGPAASTAAAGAAKVGPALNATATAATSTATAAKNAAAGLTGTGTAAKNAAAGLTGTETAAKNAAAGLTRMQVAANANNISLGAMRANTANIAAQFQDIGVTAAMGMAPLQIALQQGTQLASVFASMKPAEALAALASGFGSLLSVTSLVTIGFVALAAVAIEYFSSVFSGGQQSEAVLQKEAELIQKVAGQWGIALPALKAYADQQQALVDQQEKLAALADASAHSTASLTSGFAAASGELADMQDKLVTLGQDNAATSLREKFDQLQKKVADGSVTQEDFNNVVTSAQTAFANAQINGNAFINMLIGLKGQAAALIPTMAALAGETAKIFGGNGSVNGRSVRGGKNGFDPNFILPDSTGVTPDVAPNREDQGALEDKLAARLAKANKQHGKTDAEKFADIATGAENSIAKLQAEKDAIGLTAEAAAELKYQTQLLNEARQKGIELSPTERQTLMDKARDMAVLEASIKKTKDALDLAKDVTKGFFSDFASGIEQGKGFWQSFGDAALNALNKIVDKLLNDVIDALFQVEQAGSSGSGGGVLGFLGSLFGGGSGGGGLGDLFGLGFMDTLARGGVVDGSGVQKFATGGIVNRPTMFAHGGGLGIMGEAGPETIMPVKRMGNGDMGVAATIPAGMMQSGAANNNQPAQLSVNVNVSGARGNAEIKEMVRQGVQDGISTYDTYALPTRVNEIAADPRVR